VQVDGCSWARFSRGRLPALGHKPFEGAAPGLHLVSEQLLGFLGVLRPVGRLVAEDIVRVCLIELRVFVESSPVAGPELAILKDLSVFEEQLVVCPLARDEVGLELDLGNHDKLVVKDELIILGAGEEGLVLGVHLVDDIAFGEGIFHVVDPMNLVAISIELLLVCQLASELLGSSEVQLVGDFDVCVVEGAAIVSHLTDVADSDTEGTHRGLGNLLAEGLVHDVARISLRVKRFQSVGELCVEEVPRFSRHETFHTEDVVGLLAVNKELDGDRGSQACGSIEKVSHLRDSQDDSVGAGLVDGSVSEVVLDGLPSDVGDEALCVGRLQTPRRHHI